MAMTTDLKLHGYWSSPFSHRVVCALKLKGIDYEYIEEDLSNKSELLLKYNPVHKQIPVLVHGGKPIVESLVILEYIEETWPDNPLLPTDPYERAMARFWIQYGVEKGPVFRAFFLSREGEEREKANKEYLEVLKVIEEQGLGEKKYFGGDTINLVDLAFAVLPIWFKAMQQVLGVQVMEPTALPRLCRWAQDFTQHPVIKENTPDYDKLVEYMAVMRERLVAQQPAA